MKRSEIIGTLIAYIIAAFAFSLMAALYLLVIGIFIIPVGVCFYIKWWGTGLFISLFFFYAIYCSVSEMFKGSGESKPRDLYSPRLFLGTLLLLPCVLYITWTLYLSGNHLFVIDLVTLVAIIVSVIVFQYARLKSHFQFIIISRIVFVLSHIILNVFCLLSHFFIWSISEDWPILYISLFVISFNIYIWITLLFTDYELHIHFFKVNISDSFLLYLRSFKDDKELEKDQNSNPMFIFRKHLYSESIYEQIGYLGYDVYCIADPTNFIDSLRDFNCFYLPHTNWEKAVLEMSLNASLIVISVGLSEGILWEVLQGYRFKEKTIYHASSYRRLCDFIDCIKNKEDVPAEFISSIIKLKEKLESYKCIYILKNYKKDNLSFFLSFDDEAIYFKLLDYEIVFSFEISDVVNNVCPYDAEIQEFLPKVQKMILDNESLTALEKESLRNHILNKIYPSSG